MEILILVVLTATIAIVTGHSHFAGSPWIARWGLVIAILMGVGQAANMSRLTYPFDSWRMYSNRFPSRFFFDFHIVSDSGVVSDYPFYSLSPWLPGPMRGYTTPAPLAARLIWRLNRCQCEKGDSELDALIAALVRQEEVRSGISVAGFKILRTAAMIEATSSPASVYTWPPGFATQ